MTFPLPDDPDLRIDVLREVRPTSLVTTASIPDDYLLGWDTHRGAIRELARQKDRLMAEHFAETPPSPSPRSSGPVSCRGPSSTRRCATTRTSSTTRLRSVSESSRASSSTSAERRSRPMSAGRNTWPTKCTLMGCAQPHRRPHHHHMLHGHLMVGICVCAMRDQPGTSPKEADRG